MLLLQALPAVVGALSELPPWLLCFGEVPCAFLLPVGAGRFDFFEIGMRIPLDGFFLVEALFVAGGILSFLFVVAGVFGCHCSETVGGKSYWEWRRRCFMPYGCGRDPLEHW